MEGDEMTQFKQDQMSSAERMGAIMMGKPVDRIPFHPQSLGGFYAINAGYSIFDVYYDMKKFHEAFKRTSEMYNFEMVKLGGYPAIGPWELGGEIKWPEGKFAQCPSVKRLPVETEEEVWKLKVPEPDVLKNKGYIPRYFEFGQLSVEDGIPFSPAIYGPWTTAGNIVGIEKLCRWVMKKPDLAHHVLRLATDFILSVWQLLTKQFGTEIMMVGISTASASNNILSPKMFERFAFPYIKEFCESLLGMGFGSIFLHICGEQNANYPIYTQLPLGNPGVISVSHEVDLEDAIAYFPDRVIYGNIIPSLIQSGTPEQVYEATVKAIEKGKKAKRGFILSPGCEMAPWSPPYNVWTIMKAIDDFGWYR
jgi:uroporphyrinogen decarboxylase